MSSSKIDIFIIADHSHPISWFIVCLFVVVFFLKNYNALLGGRLLINRKFSSVNGLKFGKFSQYCMLCCVYYVNIALHWTQFAKSDDDDDDGE